MLFEDILSAGKKISNLKEQISSLENKINDIYSIRENFDKSKLIKGELTGDILLDAALCLSNNLHSESDKWTDFVPVIYKRLKEENEKIFKNSGSFFLYNKTDPRDIFCLDLDVDMFFGILGDNSKLDIRFFESQHKD